MTRFLYESKMPNFKDGTLCFELYKISHKYDVEALKTACRIQILRQLQAYNLVAWAVNGHMYNDDELKNAAISMMAEHHGPLSDLHGWECLEKVPALSLEIAKRVKKDTT